MLLLSLTLGACAPERTYRAWDEIEGRTWRVRSIDGRAVVPGSEIVLTFGADRVVSGSAQNQFRAGYEVDGTAISIEPAAVTRMFVDEPPGAMEQEGRFIVLLQEVAAWEGRLVLKTEDGREIVLEGE